MSDKRDNPTIHGKSPVNAVDTFYNRSHGATEHPLRRFVAQAELTERGRGANYEQRSRNRPE
jgi:hypothetical protein